MPQAANNAAIANKVKITITPQDTKMAGVKQAGKRPQRKQAEQRHEKEATVNAQTELNNRCRHSDEPRKQTRLSQQW